MLSNCFVENIIKVENDNIDQKILKADICCYVYIQSLLAFARTKNADGISPFIISGLNEAIYFLKCTAESNSKAWLNDDMFKLPFIDFIFSSSIFCESINYLKYEDDVILHKDTLTNACNELAERIEEQRKDEKIRNDKNLQDAFIIFNVLKTKCCDTEPKVEQ